MLGAQVPSSVLYCLNTRFQRVLLAENKKKMFVNVMNEVRHFTTHTSQCPGIKHCVGK